jgi:hypothetical protein
LSQKALRCYCKAANQLEAELMHEPLPWAVGFFFGNVERSMELWTVIAGISGVDE